MTRRWATVLLAVLSLSLPAALDAYEGEHYVWTYYVALQCGFSERQAFQLASGAYAVDWDTDTGPMPTGFDYAKITWGFPPESQRQIWIRHHAFTENVFRDSGGPEAVEASKQRRMDRLRLIGRLDGNPGPLLHYTQDYTPHFGWDDVRGHGPAGHLPDFLAADPAGGWAATERTVTELRSFAADRGLSIGSCDTGRLRQVFGRLVEANPVPVRMNGSVADLRERINAEIPRSLGGPVRSGMTFGHLAGIFAASGMTTDDMQTAFAVGPSLRRSLQVVHRAVEEDKEAGRIDPLVEGLPPYYGSLPEKWIEYDYDSEGHVSDPRYPVEKPTFTVGAPSMTSQLTGEGPEARVLVDWRIPFELADLADLGFLDLLPVQLRSADPSFAGSTRYVGNGRHVFSGRANVARSRFDARERVTFDAAAYGIGTEQVELTLSADLPPPKTPEESDELRTLIEQLESLADEAEVTAATARSACTAAEQMAGQLVAEVDAGVASARTVWSAARPFQSAAQREGRDLATEMRRASSQAEAAAQTIALLRDEAGQQAGRACADRVPPAGGLTERARAELERLRAAVLVLHGLQGGARALDPPAGAGSGDLEAVATRLQQLQDTVRAVHDQLNAIAGDDERLRGVEGRAADVLSQITRFLDRPGVDPSTAMLRADRAWGRIQAAMQSTAGCGEDVRATYLNDLGARLAEALERVQRRRDQIAEEGAVFPQAAPEGLEGRIADAESALAVSELFLESIANREIEAQECLADPPTDQLPSVESDSGDSRDPGTGQGGWTLDGDVETVEARPDEVAPAPPAPGAAEAQPVPAPQRIARTVGDDLAAARDAFARCDFVGARSLARRAQAVEPDHPWLAANLGRIQRLAAQQRDTVAGLRRARSLAGAGKLKEAREAMRAAASGAPGCMSDQIASLDRGVSSALGERRQRNRDALRDGLTSLIGAVGEVAAVAAAANGGVAPPTPWSGVQPRPTPGIPATGSTSGTGGGGTSAEQPSCAAVDPRRQLRPVLASLEPEERAEVVFFVEQYRVPQGTIYTVAPAGAEHFAQLHAIVDNMIRQYGAGQVSAPSRTGPYRSLDAAWNVVRGRCSNVYTY